jgi:hypothetical protein
MGWDELRTMVERSVHLRVPDAQTAARLRKIQPTELVPADAAELAATWDAGPLTQQELRRLAERSTGKAAPVSGDSGSGDSGSRDSARGDSASGDWGNGGLGSGSSLKRHPRGMRPIQDGEQAVVLELIRLYAQEYSASIPNFLCYRNTRFFKEQTPFGRWKLDTELKERLSHTGEEDDHEIVAVDGKEVQGKVLVLHGGLTVSGEFGNVMRRVFEAETETTFTWMAGKPGAEEVVLGFVVSEEKSSMRISSGDEEVIVGYAGEVHASPATGQIYRIRLTMDPLPKGHPIRGATWDIFYGPVKVEEQELLLPVRASVEAFQQGRFVRNEATYTDYQKYTADSSIRFGETVSAPE